MQRDFVITNLPFAEPRVALPLIFRTGGRRPAVPLLSRAGDGTRNLSAPFSLCYHYTIRNVHIAITICKQKENIIENGSKTSKIIRDFITHIRHKSSQRNQKRKFQNLFRRRISAFDTGNLRVGPITVRKMPGKIWTNSREPIAKCYYIWYN